MCEPRTRETLSPPCRSAPQPQSTPAIEASGVSASVGVRTSSCMHALQSRQFGGFGITEGCEFICINMQIDATELLAALHQSDVQEAGGDQIGQPELIGRTIDHQERM